MPKEITKKNKEAKILRFRLAETEHELVVRIPLVVGFRPIVVQPQTVVVAFQLEDVRVAVRVGVVRHVIRDTVHLVRVAQKTGLYFIRDRESTDASYQVFSFLLTDMQIPSAKPWPGRLSTRMSRKGLEKPWPFNVTDLKSVYQNLLY